MSKFTFKKATKTQARLRLGLVGPSGGGKTLTALIIAHYLERPIAVIDTERGSASKYAGYELPDGERLQFDVLELDTFSPKTYIEAIQAAGEAGFGTLVIDSLSHAWMGKDGALEQVDRVAKRSNSSNTFAAWRDVTPQHNAFVDAILAAKMHVIGTMRARTEYILEENERGKKVPRKIGIQPVQRDGLEYEFDVTADLTLDNEMIIGKTRCPLLAGKVFRQAGKDVAMILRSWLQDGAPMPEETPDLPVSRPSDRPSEPPMSAKEIEELYKTSIAAAKTRAELKPIGIQFPKANIPAEAVERLKAIWLERHQALAPVNSQPQQENQA
jgi:hypothetical protein